MVEVESRTALVAALLFAAAAGIAAAPALAAEAAYPQRPIRLLVPFAPGGATDIVARVLAPKLGERIGQSVVVDNRVGAAGNIAVDLVAGASADGYTLLVGNVSTNAINPLLFAGKMKANALKDLAGITLLASIPNVILGGPKMPANTLQEALAFVRERPGQLNYQAPLGSYSHLDMLALLAAARANMVHLPSRGAGDTATALLRNEIQMANSNVASNIGSIRAGQIKAYAVTSARRVPELPDVPTLAEAGFPGIGSDNWNGLFAPRATPKTIIDTLFRVTTAVMQDKDTLEFFARRLIPVETSRTPAEFEAFVQGQSKRWAQIIRDNQVRID